MFASMPVKVALVTGASRGIGAALALDLAREGYAVACAARSTRARPDDQMPGTLDDVVEQIAAAGGTAISVPVDLADRAQVAAMVERTVAELGRLDVLVNNAALGSFGGIDAPLAEHDLLMAVNLDGPFMAIRHAVPHMRAAGEGRIVNVSSFIALHRPANTSSMTYGISKIALERLTVDVAWQLKGDGIAVNAFRVDAPVASEGAVVHTLANRPGVDFEGWEPSESAAEGIMWMLHQPVTYTGQLESMRHLAVREDGVMPTVAARTEPLPPTQFQQAPSPRN